MPYETSERPLICASIAWDVLVDKGTFCRRVKPGNTMMSAAAGLTALGVSATGFAKMWFRFPDIPTLVTNRWFLLYVAVSFFIGAAVSYYFDSADSKIMDIISAALRLVGGSFVFYSLCQIWEVGAAAVLLLLVIALRPGKSTPKASVMPGTPAGLSCCVSVPVR